MLKKLNFGIIGISKGNGHPFSFSEIINGINKDKFKKNCNYNVIKKYIFKNKVPNKKLININVVGKNNKLFIKKNNQITGQNIISFLNNTIDTKYDVDKKLIIFKSKDERIFRNGDHKKSDEALIVQITNSF